MTITLTRSMLREKITDAYGERLHLGDRALDVNLGSLIEIIEELRSSSQLIVITHQKRTMEIADALYGFSMRGDGVTQVIGQRLRESDAVSA